MKNPNNFKILEEAEIKEGMKVLLCASIDVPIMENEVADDFRLLRIKPTLEYLKNKKAKIILIGHVGHSGEGSTEPIAKYFDFKYINSLDCKVVKEEVSELRAGEGVVLKNIRADAREEKNDVNLAKELASLADIYVNESFADSHRNYVSTVGIAKFLPSYAGLEMAQEIEELTKILEPKRPFVCIFGGAKADTKISLVRRFADKADVLFIGGSLANTIFKVKGLETGKSLVDGDLNEAKKILEYNNVRLPVDVVVSHNGQPLTKSPDTVQKEENMLDAGIDTIQMIGAEITKAKTVLWNGPLGMYERGYKEGTETLARIIAESKAYSVIGGGDTITSIKKLGLLDKFSFISIGGGAMTDFLATGTLPGIEALKNGKF